MRLALAAAVAFAACHTELDYTWDQRTVLCSLPVDDLTHPAPWQDVEALIEEASYRGVAAIMHAHAPGKTVSRDAIDRILSLADSHHLDYATFADLAGPAERPHAALVLAFDDNAIDEWFSIRDLLDAHGARVTFFVSRWEQQPDVAIAELVELARDGHDLEPHSVNHLNADDYVQAHGLDAYLADEVLPSIQVMVDAGYTPTTYAYPFGAHDDAIDRAVLEHVSRVRTTPGGCPR